MNKEFISDVGVIGAGAAGLMVTKKLSELGYKVTLVDRGKLANGPSTKNEGWLHDGGYHAGMTEDPVRAQLITRQIKYGHEQIKRYTPEAVEDPGVPVLALVKDQSLAERAVSRWEANSVDHHLLTRRQLEEFVPELNTGMVAAGFSMSDESVNFRILYQKLLYDSERAGAQVLTHTTAIPEDENRAALTFPDGMRGSLQADIFICTTGLGTGDTFGENTDLQKRTRYWKSHSLIVPRLTKHSTYFIDPQEASVMNHGNFGIGCQAEDDFQVERPTLEVVDSSRQGLFDSVARMFPCVEKYRDTAKVVACVKPDIIQEPGMARSVDQEIHEPLPGYLVAFPGKVTTTPLLADRLVHKVFDRQSDERIALRPGDIVDFRR